MGLAEAAVVHAEAMGQGYSFYVVYGRCTQRVDLERVRVARQVPRLAALRRQPVADPAHARIVGIETTRARASTGVAAVLTAEDLRPHARPIRALSRMRGYTVTEMPALASGKARYAGEAVAAGGDVVDVLQPGQGRC